MTKNAEGAIAYFAEDFAILRKDVADLTEAISLLVQHPTQVAEDAVEDAKNKIASAPKKHRPRSARRAAKSRPTSNAIR